MAGDMNLDTAAVRACLSEVASETNQTLIGMHPCGVSDRHWILSNAVAMEGINIDVQPVDVGHHAVVAAKFTRAISKMDPIPRCIAGSGAQIISSLPSFGEELQRGKEEDDPTRVQGEVEQPMQHPVAQLGRAAAAENLDQLALGGAVPLAQAGVLPANRAALVAAPLLPAAPAWGTARMWAEWAAAGWDVNAGSPSVRDQLATRILMYLAVRAVPRKNASHRGGIHMRGMDAVPRGVLLFEDETSSCRYAAFARKVARHGPEVMIYGDAGNHIYYAVLVDLVGDQMIYWRHKVACDALEALLAENPTGSWDHLQFPLPVLLNQLVVEQVLARPDSLSARTSRGLQWAVEAYARSQGVALHEVRLAAGFRAEPVRGTHPWAWGRRTATASNNAGTGNSRGQAAHQMTAWDPRSATPASDARDAGAASSGRAARAALVAGSTPAAAAVATSERMAPSAAAAATSQRLAPSAAAAAAATSQRLAPSAAAAAAATSQRLSQSAPVAASSAAASAAAQGNKTRWTEMSDEDHNDEVDNGGREFDVDGPPVVRVVTREGLEWRMMQVSPVVMVDAMESVLRSERPLLRIAGLATFGRGGVRAPVRIWVTGA